MVKFINKNIFVSVGGIFVILVAFVLVSITQLIALIVILILVIITGLFRRDWKYFKKKNKEQRL